MFFTKSVIFGANIEVSSSEQTGSVQVPSKVIVKRYRENLARTSEEADAVALDFRRERAMLEFGIGMNGGRNIKVYPELYSAVVPECDNEMTLLREYVAGQNLKELAQSGKLKWETPSGTPAISDALVPMILLHVETPNIARGLFERGLLEFGTPEKAKDIEIAWKRAGNFSCYIQKLAAGIGRELSEDELDKLRDSFFNLDRRYVSRRNLLSIIDGELDVFPHHALQRRLVDAGGVEVGGFIRDLAVYSDPVFKQLWKEPAEMVEKVVPEYLNVRREIEDTLRYRILNADENELKLGLLLASFAGNIRVAAAIVHYNQDNPHHIREETGKYTTNAIAYLSAFGKGCSDEYHYNIDRIKALIEKIGLNDIDYRFTSDSEIHTEVNPLEHHYNDKERSSACPRASEKSLVTL